MAISTGVFTVDGRKAFMAKVGSGEFGLKNLCGSAPEDFLLRNVDPYGDTMFNGHQLPRLLNEIGVMTTMAGDQQRDDDVEMLDRLRKVAAEAIRVGGYLWFIGD